jgi:alpha-L-fucosidase
MFLNISFTTIQRIFVKHYGMTLLLITSSLLHADYQPSESNLAAREWFKEARFGMFIHWGVYSQLAHGEWVMHNKKIPLKEYEEIASTFNPVKFDAAAWVAIAKAAGMKYITITTKHHDGFAMFGTQQNSWNIVDYFGRDLFKELADECHKQDIKLFCYYSQLDWHHNDFFPRGRTGHMKGRAKTGTWENYIQFMNAQLTELLTNYGHIAGIWFDGWWDKPEAQWDLPTTFDMIHRLQPHALIGSNHHNAPFEGQDFQMFEQDLPGECTAGFEKDTSISQLPLESCVTINKLAWGIDLIDRHNGLKTTKQVMNDLVGAAGRNANLLLNVGPLADGTFPRDVVTRLSEVGAWLEKYGESIYATHGGPLQPRVWGVTTQRDNKIYVHLLNWKSHDALWLPITNVAQCSYLAHDDELAWQMHQGGIVLNDVTLKNEYDTVIVVETNT